MAEVLITLAIIGVVAAMTIPTLTANYKKKVVEVKLSKFNSMMQQVVQLSQIENGPVASWDTSDTEAFFLKYLKNYLKVLKVEKQNTNDLSVDLADGTNIFFEGTGKEVLHAYLSTEPLKTARNGYNHFHFLFYTQNSSNLKGSYWCNPYMGEGTAFVPYFALDNNDLESYWDDAGNCRRLIQPQNDEIRDYLMNNATYGCAKGRGVYCTKLIQMNGWKIPEDYPIKF